MKKHPSKTDDILHSLPVMVGISVFLSVVFYLIIANFFQMPSFLLGLIISIIIPLAVSLPMSIVTTGYLKKIKKQKLELEKLDATNKELFSLISHDIRSPITTLKGMTELLLEDNIEAGQGKKYLNQLSKKTGDVLKFLDDLLQWSKRQTENKPIEYSQFYCQDVIYSTYELLENKRKEKNINLKIGNLNNPIYTDRVSYSFVFRNIYHNAIKFTKKGGEIEIYTTLKEGKTHTIVKDSGIGISKDNIEEILNKDKWFTLQGTSNEIGTGFGIITCINFLNKNNGELLIESEPEKGTKITIILPSIPS